MSDQVTSSILQIARSQVGVKESPINSNRGPEVDAYLKSVALAPGNPWCMAFVYWCAWKAYMQANVKVIPLVKTGGVMYQWDHVTDCKKIRPFDKTVKPGDIFIMRFANGQGHTGFVETVGAGVVYTIEGNTNDDGSREGYEVARRVRRLASIFGFIQLP